MVTDKLRKYVLPNIPYVFIGWAFLKLGTAYRLAAGSDFAHKFIGLGQTVGAAFADFAPGLAPFDWLVGIVGAAVFRLLIYFKSKNAKKYRRDAEYGNRSGCGAPAFQKNLETFCPKVISRRPALRALACLLSPADSGESALCFASVKGGRHD